MAHATASLANDGVVYRPHLVKELLDHERREITLIDPKPERKIPFKYENFEYVKQAMAKVLQGGTARRISYGLQYTMGGKTGTAQVVQIKQGARYNAAALAEQHRDHAWFISFAPVEQPQIAIAVLLENGGWGATAAPLARSLTDYYLLTLQGGKAGKETAVQTASEAQAAQTHTQLTAAGEPLTTPSAPSVFRQAYQSAAGIQTASGAAP